MDKMLVSPDGDVIITNDGATILEKMEVCIRLQIRFTKSPSHIEDGFRFQNIFERLYLFEFFFFIDPSLDR